jgi:hypothetical protein
VTVKLTSNYYTTLARFKFFRAAGFRRVGLIDKLNAKEHYPTTACEEAAPAWCAAYGAKF